MYCIPLKCQVLRYQVTILDPIVHTVGASYNLKWLENYSCFRTNSFGSETRWRRHDF